MWEFQEVAFQAALDAANKSRVFVMAFAAKNIDDETSQKFMHAHKGEMGGREAWPYCVPHSLLKQYSIYIDSVIYAPMRRRSK